MLKNLSTFQIRRLFLIGTSLAFVAGLVNSVAFLALGTYVSHISGHATRSAIELLEFHPGVAGIFFMATLCFILGASFTAVILRGRFLTSLRANSMTPLIIEAGLIAYVAFHMAIRPHRPGLYPEQAPFLLMSTAHAFYIFILSFAMGMQNALFRRSSGIIIRTTHMTGIATDMGISIGWLISTSLIYVVDKLRFKKGESEKVFRENLQEKFSGKSLLLHISLFMGFLSGVMAGTFGYLKPRFNVLFLAVFILMFNAFNEYKTHHLHHQE